MAVNCKLVAGIEMGMGDTCECRCYAVPKARQVATGGGMAGVGWDSSHWAWQAHGRGEWLDVGERWHNWALFRARRSEAGHDGVGRLLRFFR